MYRKLSMIPTLAPTVTTNTPWRGCTRPWGSGILVDEKLGDMMEHGAVELAEKSKFEKQKGGREGNRRITCEIWRDSGDDRRPLGRGFMHNAV